MIENFKKCDSHTLRQLNSPLGPALMCLFYGEVQLIESQLRACLHGGGGPQAGEVTSLGGVTRLSI